MQGVFDPKRIIWGPAHGTEPLTPLNCARTVPDTVLHNASTAQGPKRCMLLPDLNFPAN